MKKLSIFIVGIALLGGLVIWAGKPADTAPTKGIQFEDITFDQALQQAKKEHKLVFMNVYATWCGPCKMLMKNTLTTSKVGTVFNKNFVNISVDAEKGEGIELAKKYKVQGHPLMLLIDPDGKVIKRILGYMDGNQLLAQVADYSK